MTSQTKPLLSEQLRPQCLADLILPSSLRSSFQRMIDTKSLMNMTFYGKPGIGKTSAARILFKELDLDVYELNGSYNSGEKTMLRDICTFASTISFLGKHKVCFVDEADYLSKDVQASLRGLIESVSDNTRFIMTVNDIDKLTQPILSRCEPICFDVSPLDTIKTIDLISQRYVFRLSGLGYEADFKTVKNIVCLYYPDLRRIANQFQLELKEKPSNKAA
jgi:DNA polymerase III delta prime subunit